MRSIRHFSVILIVASLLTACGNNYNRIETGGTERTNVRLDESVAVLVTTPKDGGYGNKLYAGSGATVARLTDAAFSQYARLVDVYPSEYHSLGELRDTIAQNGYGYIVVPTIAVWGHKEEWSKIPNEVKVKISVIDAATGKELSSNFLESRQDSSSGISVLFDSDSENPEDILADMADDYVDDLYGVMLAFPNR